MLYDALVDGDDGTLDADQTCYWTTRPGDSVAKLPHLRYGRGSDATMSLANAVSQVRRVNMDRS